MLTTSIALLAQTEQCSVGELLEIREFLEIPAARLAAERRTEQQLQALRAAVHAGRDGPDHGWEGNRSFHELVLAASGNGLLQALAAPIFGVLRTRFLRDLAQPAFWSTVTHDHDGLLAAIEAGDAARAGDEMRDHLRRLRATYEDIDRRVTPV
jgi:DNA-binding FadR family transcriptional regulator